MFDKPKHGWVNISLEGVEIAPASYISDVANDTLEAMIYALEESKDFCASYDAEGYEFKIISDDYSTFVIMMVISGSRNWNLQRRS